MSAVKSPQGNSVHVPIGYGTAMEKGPTNGGSGAGNGRGAGLPTRFFKIVGIPIRSGECDGSVPLYAGDPSVRSPGGTFPAVPDSLMSPDDTNHQVDVFEASNEEPFTLETFESLLALHAEKQKDFIVARVTTVDPQDPSRFYYSYYAAHHINKVLFRTQPEKGLLHRMKAKNPLNNMVIVGDVYYYLIKSSELNLEHLKAFERAQENGTLLSPDGELSHRSNSSEETGSARPGDLWVDTSPISSGRRRSRLLSPECFLNDSKTEQSKLDITIWNNRMPSPVYSSSKFGSQTDSSLLQFRDGSRGKLLLMMKPEAGVLFKKTVTDKVSKDNHFRRVSNASTATSDNSQKGLVSDGNEVEHGTPGIQDSQLDAAILKSPFEASPLYGDTLKKLKSPSSPSKSNFPQLKLESWSNEHSSISMSDWIKAHTKLEWHSRKTFSLEGQAGEYVPLSNLGRSMSNAKRYNSATTHRKVSNASAETVKSFNCAAYFYELRYYASDDDFLMKPAIRSFFMKNALESADAVLFSIPGTVGGPPVIVPEGSAQHPALPNFLYAVIQRPLQVSWLNRIVQNLKTPRVRMVLTAYLAVVVLILIFLIPREHIAMTAVLFSGIAVLYLILR